MVEAVNASAAVPGTAHVRSPASAQVWPKVVPATAAGSTAETVTSPEPETTHETVPSAADVPVARNAPPIFADAEVAA